MVSSTFTVAKTVRDQHEADLMRRLSNKNIVAYYGVTEIQNAKIVGHCMIMEYMANDSLFSYLKNNKKRFYTYQIDGNSKWGRSIMVVVPSSSFLNTGRK